LIGQRTQIDVPTEDPAIAGKFRAPPRAGFALSRDPASPSNPDRYVLYCVYFDLGDDSGGTEQDVDLYFARSTTDGETWVGPTGAPGPGIIVDDQQAALDQFFPFAAVSERMVAGQLSVRLHLIL
jgi:hypothetical protein